MKNIRSGAYPVMITPYNKDMSVDYSAAEALVEWYWEQGCDGIFAACLSSEIFELTLEERVKLSALTKRTADRLAKAEPRRTPMSVVASGHVSDAFDDQVKELNAIADTGVDAVVLISNRFDIANTGFDAWRTDAEHLLERLPSELALGIYECPAPYKRPLDADILRWIVQSKRFSFIKDTCCDADEIAKRLKLLNGSGVKLFNAHAGSLLQSLRDGGDGYCGVMANYMARPFVKLCACYRDDPWLADYLQAFLDFAATSEGMGYPISAKYYLDVFEKVPMTHLSRNKSESVLTDRYKTCLSQLRDSVESLHTNGLI
ncbi:MAG: dihydrodipicolinate synthase family protein [Clostridia bacterium]|nr:dihydrodipicolinate synthase family protein [Clostridia bacterium]